MKGKKASLPDARKPLEQRKTGRWDTKEGSEEEMFQRRGTWKSDVHEEKALVVFTIETSRWARL